MKFEEIIKDIKPGTIIESKSREDVMICTGVSWYWYNIKTKKKGMHVALDSTFFNYDDWEEYVEQDDWNWNKATPRAMESKPLEAIKTLKEKILEDMGKLFYGKAHIQIEELIDKRFGF